MKFYVTIAQTLEKIIEVDAKNPMDARIQVENDFNDGKYVLDPVDDFVCTDFYVEESEEKENKLS